jgi:hypothetical protein
MGAARRANRRVGEAVRPTCLSLLYPPFRRLRRPKHAGDITPTPRLAALIAAAAIAAAHRVCNELRRGAGSRPT